MSNPSISSGSRAPEDRAEPKAPDGAAAGAVTIPAIIPASGRSRRMGSPKPLLDSGRGTFLARILRSFREGGAGPLLVVVRDPEGAVAREARQEGGRVLENPDPTPGPVASLQVGIRHLPPDAPGVFFCPVDHPLFRPDTVRSMDRTFRDRQPPMVAPSFRGRSGHPVLFSRELFPELLEEELPQGARTVVGRYHEERILVPVDDPGILADIDTPDDYARYFS